MYPLRIRRQPRPQAEARAQEALALVDLGDLGSRRISELSGGQQQRVALARAIVYEPPILLMDEPLSALDKKLREQMQIEVRHLHQRLGMTTVYVTHDQREALTMSDRIAVIDHGRFRQIDKPVDLYERPGNRFIAEFIGESHFLSVRVRNGGAYLGDTALKLSHPPRHGAPSQFLVLRPEKLKVVDQTDGAGLNVFAGQVKELVYQGESSLLYVSLPGGEPIAVRHPAGSTERPLPPIGAPIKLGLAPGDTIIVPAEEA
jgi:putative spermidine/putrescine transport system ATP-binding protein